MEMMNRGWAQILDDFEEMLVERRFDIETADKGTQAT